MISMCFIAVLQLSVAGGAAGILFLYVERWLYEKIPSKYIIWLNIVVLLMFVTPFFSMLMTKEDNYQSFLEDSLMVITGKNEIQNKFYDMIQHTGISNQIVTVWLIGMILYFIYGMLYYIYTIKTIKKGISLSETIWQRVLSEVQKELHINKKISLYGKIDVAQPCTIGILKQYILIPSLLVNQLNETEMKAILRHECMHMKRNDVLLKAAMQILSCLNWFNPLFAILRNSLYDWIEVGCDEELTEKFTKEEKKTYIKVLLKLTEEKQKMKRFRFAAGFGERKNTLNRRIKYIMSENKKRDTLGRIVVTAFLLFTIPVSSVAAKDTDVVLHSIFSENVQFVDVNDFKVNEDGSVTITQIVEESHYMGDIKDTTRILQEEEETAEPKHTHNKVKTTIENHIKYSNGSCEVFVYNADYCAGCDTYWTKDVVSSKKYKKCPH